MTTGIGQMVPGHDAGGRRYVVELALNVDLMLEGNGRERIDTLVHEMAHAADWLLGGGLGHGDGWKRWARYAGCRERACAEHPIRRRARGVSHVTRVPRLPWAARFQAA
jgi:predicted SprT family Zn-dependent metalloprotease